MNNDVYAEIKFPTTESYTVKDIKKVQQELLVMTKIITKILETNDIPYFMAFGTLIGAIKFQGFLPWDDDIDLFLFDDSYDKAITLLEEKLPEHLIVHSEKNDPSYFLAWNSVKNINTSVEITNTYHPHNKLLGYQCLGIDLYRLTKVKQSEFENYKYDEAIKFFKRKLDKNIISSEEYLQEVSKLDLNLKDSVSSAHKSNNEVFAFVVKLNQSISINSVLPLKKLTFEDTQFYAPNKPLEVLSCSFDNLESLPPYEERKAHIQSVKFLG